MSRSSPAAPAPSLHRVLHAPGWISNTMGKELLSFAFTENGIILREMSPCCSISACSHQLKSSEGREATCVAFTCGVTGREESRVQVLPGAETLPLNPQSKPLILSHSSASNPNQRGGFSFKLSVSSTFGGMAVPCQQKVALRTQLQTSAPNKAVLMKKTCSLGNVLVGGSEETQKSINVWSELRSVPPDTW